MSGDARLKAAPLDERDLRPVDPDDRWQVGRVVQLGERRPVRADDRDARIALLEPRGAMQHAVSLLQHRPAGAREVRARDALRRQPGARLEQLASLLDRAEEVLEASTAHRPRVGDHQHVIERDHVAVPLVDVPREVVGRVVDVDRVMADRVRL